MLFNINPAHDLFTFFELCTQSEAVKIVLMNSINQNDFTTYNKINMEKYIKKAYKEDLIVMKVNLEKVRKLWSIKQNFFNQEIKKIFGEKTYNINEVIAYPSIWPIYGRFSKQKIITFPYKEGIDQSIFVIAHELLHLIFYHHLILNYQLSNKQIESNLVWKLSEVINVFIQNQEDWIKKFKIKSKPYLGTETMYLKMEKIWSKNNNVDEIIQHIIKTYN